MVCLLPVLFQPTITYNTQDEFRISFLPIPLFSDTLHVNCPKIAPPSRPKITCLSSKVEFIKPAAISKGEHLYFIMSQKTQVRADFYKIWNLGLHS